MYKARKMLAKEHSTTTINLLRAYCVEHESGRIEAANLTWTEACAKVRELGERELARQLAALA
jgi:hypothetical protein